MIPHGIFPYGLGFVGLGELRELFNVDRVVVASATQVSQGGSAASTRQHTIAAVLPNTTDSSSKHPTRLHNALQRSVRAVYAQLAGVDRVR